MASLRSMGGKSFRMGAKRGDLGVEVVAEWLVELGVDDKVSGRARHSLSLSLALSRSVDVPVCRCLSGWLSGAGR
eukprot:3391387-Rhodomonas_salina.1